MTRRRAMVIDLEHCRIWSVNSSLSRRFLCPEIMFESLSRVELHIGGIGAHSLSGIRFGYDRSINPLLQILANCIELLNW